MFTAKQAKDLIDFRLKTKGVMDTLWCKENSDDAFFGCAKVIGLLPTPCGNHHEPVYNSMGINCNTLNVSHFRKNDCLILEDRYVAVRVYICCGKSKYSDDTEANNHLGEIYVAFERFSNRGDGEIECSDRGIDLSLDELEQRDPEFLRNLVFNLK